MPKSSVAIASSIDRTLSGYAATASAGASATVDEEGGPSESSGGGVADGVVGGVTGGGSAPYVGDPTHARQSHPEPRAEAPEHTPQSGGIGERCRGHVTGRH